MSAVLAPIVKLVVPILTDYSSSTWNKNIHVKSELAFIRIHQDVLLFSFVANIRREVSVQYTHTWPHVDLINIRSCLSYLQPCIRGGMRKAATWHQHLIHFQPHLGTCHRSSLGSYHSAAGARYSQRIRCTSDPGPLVTSLVTALGLLEAKDVISLR